jgi:opacity protein-like surface antigen
MKIASVLSSFVLGLLLLTPPVYADGFVAPTIGVNFGGDAGATLIDATQDNSKASYGVVGGFMTDGVFGMEEDFAYGPSFFGKGGPINSSRVATLMTNLLIGIPVGGQHGPGIRPFASIGVGLINRNVDSTVPSASFSSNDFGYDVGAGVMGYFADHIGLRAGVQYFRNFQRTGSNIIGLDAGEFNFFRGSFGVLFRF